MTSRALAALVVSAATLTATTSAQAQPPAAWSPWPPEVVYHHQSKSVGGAFALEFFVPGAGSVYGGHSSGAAVTWGLMGAGTLALLMAMASFHHEERPSSPSVGHALVFGGFGLVLGGRIYGLVDAVQSTSRHNYELRGRLGLSGGPAFGVGPIPSPMGTAFGPTVAGSF